MLHASASPYAMRQRGASRNPPFNLGPCPLGLGSLRTGTTCDINRTETKRKKTTLGDTTLTSMLGHEWAQAYPGPDVGQAGGSWPGAICKSCPGFQKIDGPQTTRADEGNIRKQTEEKTCPVEGRTVGPSRVLLRNPQKPLSGRWSL